MGPAVAAAAAAVATCAAPGVCCSSTPEAEVERRRGVKYTVSPPPPAQSLFALVCHVSRQGLRGMERIVAPCCCMCIGCVFYCLVVMTGGSV